MMCCKLLVPYNCVLATVLVVKHAMRKVFDLSDAEAVLQVDDTNVFDCLQLLEIF